MMLKLFFCLLIIIVPEASYASNICSPSSCGIIRNISFPFRLKHDPPNCGDPTYELSCENNVTTILYLNSQKYRVRAINYHNTTIRLVDVSINNTTCSFPKISLYAYNFTSANGYPYGQPPVVASPINFLTCPHPLNNTSIFKELPTPCAATLHGRHAYVKVGHMNISDVPYMCKTQLIVMTSWKFHHLNNLSLSEIHLSLLYGFELSWLKYGCGQCKSTSGCLVNEDHTVICFTDKLFTLFFIVLVSVFLIILAILACVCVGVSIPAKIIIVLTWAFLGFLYFFRWNWTFSHVNSKKSHSFVLFCG